MSFVHSMSHMNQNQVSVDVEGGSSSRPSMLTTKTAIATSTSIKNSQQFRHSVQVGKNIGKVRWLESQSQEMAPDFTSTEHFVVGSSGHLENEVSLWQFSVHGSKEEQKYDIRVLRRYSIIGKVTDLVSVNNDSFALTTSLGGFSMLKIIQSQPDEDSMMNADILTQIQPTFSKQLHSFRKGNSHCPATGLAVSGTSAVTVGEDGSIFELCLTTNNIVQSLDFVDPLTLCTVKYVGRSTIATGNSGGQVKIWDLRVSTPRTVVQTMNHLNELSGACSIAQHTTQSHVLLVGYESGRLDLWDIRQGSISEPTANLPDEEGAVSEIYFHGLNPDHFFTCSQSGEMTHYFPSNANSNFDLVQTNDYDMDLNIEFLKHGLSCKNLYSSSFPINSMSLSRNNRLVCGGDSGIAFSTELVL